MCCAMITSTLRTMCCDPWCVTTCRCWGSFTARYHVNRPVYFEEFGGINQAITREKEIKRLSRRRKIKLIESMNPDWRDLSLEWVDPAPEPGIPHAAATRGNDKSAKRV